MAGEAWRGGGGGGVG
uniref:Uncharacterized protein n=1 Tax=Arundo donax TaxID=35708 RepID=A0A0A9HK13_ARUDO